ncbi:hypothetical protein GC194_09700 [bacterium]|nr:hypothetical protein [bacterium]
MTPKYVISALLKTALALLFTTCLINHSRAQIKSNVSFQVFDQHFENLKWSDSIVIDFFYSSAVSNFFSHERQPIDSTLLKSFLPDSLSSYSWPVAKWMVGYNSFYFLINRIDNWRDGVLAVYNTDLQKFESIELVHVSSPGDGSQFYLKSVIKVQNDSMVLLKRSYMRSTSLVMHGFRVMTCRTTTKYLWRSELGSFERFEALEKCSKHFTRD